MRKMDLSVHKFPTTITYDNVANVKVNLNKVSSLFQHYWKSILQLHQSRAVAVKVFSIFSKKLRIAQPE